jgi:phage/conjugal plasmid C-4 type zinc finger TraR family protein
VNLIAREKTLLTKDSFGSSFADNEFPRIRTSVIKDLKMDDIDKANDLADSLRDAAVLRIQREVSRVNTNKECVDCDEDIDAQRRAKVPGAIRCINCQDVHERRLKTHRQ